jgi:uncharacterized protein
MSIPIFPNFQPLTVEHKQSVETALIGFMPYSDFDFTSLWSWDVEESIAISTLHQNLVFLFVDYLTKEKFFSFVGKNEIDATIKILLEHSMAQGHGNSLKLIPGEIVELIKNPQICEVVADRDNFDYILHLPTMVNIRARKNKSRRRKVELFDSLYGENTSIRNLELANTESQAKLLTLFDTWAGTKTTANTEIQSEREAIIRLFQLPSPNKLQLTAIFLRDELIGFSIDEILNGNYAMGHFIKANTKYSGVFQYLEHHVNLNLASQGVEFLNIEQDLGIETLRMSKMGQHPHLLLEKFILTQV